MSFSVTSLQLVNRVHRRRRMPDVGAFTETEDLATLDAVNAAIEEVLSSKRWEFDMRRGQIALRPYMDGFTFSTVTDYPTLLTAIRTDGLDAEDTYGDYILRALVSGSTSYSNTSIRILESSDIFALYSTIMTAAVDINEVITSAEGSILYSEYILPQEVRNVIRVTHQQEDLTIEQIDPVVEFDELYPRPNIEYGPPRVISVGGFDSPTRISTDTTTAPGLRMIVWPIPDEAYILDYTYHYRHPALEAVDDVLEGVPPNVVDQIVNIAASDMKAYYEKDYDALRLRAFSQQSLDRMHNEDGGMYADRKPVGNWSGRAGRFQNDRSVTQGRLIGGG